MSLRVVTFKIEESLLESVDKYAKDMRMTRSEVIREALREYLRNHCGYGFKRVINARRLRVFY